MQRLGVSDAVRPLYGSLGVKGLKQFLYIAINFLYLKGNIQMFLEDTELPKKM